MLSVVGKTGNDCSVDRSWWCGKNCGEFECLKF